MIRQNDLGITESVKEWFGNDSALLTEYSNYWLSQNDFENYPKFFNPEQTPEYKGGYEYIITPIKNNFELFLPMLMKKFTLNEANKFVVGNLEEAINTKLIEANTIDRNLKVGLKDYDSENFVKVRLHSPVDIPATLKSQDGIFSISPPLPYVTKLKQVIFHIHGGGFISMNSFNH